MKDKYDALFIELCHRKPDDEYWTTTETRWANNYHKYCNMIHSTAWLMILFMITLIIGLIGAMALIFYKSMLGECTLIACCVALIPVTLHFAHAFFKLIRLQKALTVGMKLIQKGWEFDLYSK